VSGQAEIRNRDRERSNGSAYGPEGGGGHRGAGRAGSRGAQPAKVLTYVPQGDPALLDPVPATLYAIRNHALPVFDTPYGVDAGARAGEVQ
jgi:hypothetical protein